MELLGVNQEALIQRETELRLQTWSHDETRRLVIRLLMRTLYLLVTDPRRYAIRKETRSSLTTGFAVSSKRVQTG